MSLSTADAVPPETGGQLHELDSFYQTDQNSLDSLREEALQAGVSCEATMVCGSASLMIIKMIRADKIDLVVLGTSALHGFERLVFGSTAEAVLREAPAPS
jgi:nucleotide-binding universal stress UspA family protein